MTWWADLSPGQGTLLSGALTAVGAVLGIFIASRFFSGKVKTLKEALDEAQKLLEHHSSTVAETLATIGERIAVLDVQTSSLSSGVARIESNVGELADSAELAESRDEGALLELDTDKWVEMRDAWLGIRDELVRRASDESIDGRTRAAYGRVDKRMIYELISRMKGKHLSVNDADDFDDALEIWNRYKNRRKEIETSDLDRLLQLRKKLAPVS